MLRIGKITKHQDSKGSNEQYNGCWYGNIHQFCESEFKSRASHFVRQSNFRSNKGKIEGIEHRYFGLNPNIQIQLAFAFSFVCVEPAVCPGSVHAKSFFQNYANHFVVNTATPGSIKIMFVVTNAIRKSVSTTKANVDDHRIKLSISSDLSN